MKVKIDKINRRILTEIHMNADISNVELGERIGLSQSACFARRKALKEGGYLVGYITEMDLDRICYNVQAYVEIVLSDTKEASHRALQVHIQNRPEFMDLMRVSGDVDYISLVCCSDLKSLNKLCQDVVAAVPAVQRTNARIVMDRLKWVTGYPLDKLQWK